MATGDRSRKLVIVFKLCGQCSMGPTDVDDQSNVAMSDGNSPGQSRKLSASDLGVLLSCNEKSRTADPASKLPERREGSAPPSLQPGRSGAFLLMITE